MSRVIYVMALGFVMMALGGCGDTHESLSKKLVSKMQEVTSALKDVKDEDSSKAAAVKINSISADIKDIEKRMSALPKPADNADTRKAEEGAFKAVMEEMGAIMKEMQRIEGNPKLMTPELSKAMGGMGGGKGGFNPF